MRYGVKQKEQSRSRIVDAAARHFRQFGFETVRLADVMQSVGLTHGGFYKHFENKEALLSDAVTLALKQVAEKLLRQTEGASRSDALGVIIDFYLSEEHVRHPELGCALAALGSEIPRLNPPLRLAVRRALQSYADQLSHLMPGSTPKQQRAAFLLLFSSMAGCVMAARALGPCSERTELLSDARALFQNTYCRGCRETA